MFNMNINCDGEECEKHSNNESLIFLFISHNIIGHNVGAFCNSCYEYSGLKSLPFITVKEIDKEEYLKLKDQIEQSKIIS